MEKEDYEDETPPAGHFTNLCDSVNISQIMRGEEELVTVTGRRFLSNAPGVIGLRMHKATNNILSRQK